MNSFRAENRAACALKLGQHENALSDAKRCVALDPAHVRGTFRVGLALHALGRYHEACPVLSKALGMQPGNKQIKTALQFAERKAMMAHYFKRQEELKALAEADDDDYLHSAWADTKALKNSLQGISGGMRAPGIR